MGQFRKKGAKIEEHVKNSKLKNPGDLYRGANDFKNDYHPITTFLEWSGIQKDLCLLTSAFFVK